MRNKIIFLLILATIALPLVSFAEVPIIDIGGGVEGIMSNIADQVWLVFAGIAIIMFLVAGILFLTANKNPGKLDQARQAVIWGVVGIIVGLFAKGIIGLVSGWL
jgi:FtsH-binding integral membrane protein